MLNDKRTMNSYWKSTLFSDVYLRNDVPEKYKNLWDNDEIANDISGFFNFYNGFLNLVNKSENASFEKWKEAETIKNWIVPIMVLLGWDSDSKIEDSYYLDNESFTTYEYEKRKTYRPDLLYFDKPIHKTYTQGENDIDRKLAEARDPKSGIKIIVEAKYWNRLSQKKIDLTKESRLLDSASGLGPEFQILKYMELFNLEFGILTDGKTWKIFHGALSKSVDLRNYTFDLGMLRELAIDITTNGKEEEFKFFAKYFYYFFAKQSHVQSSNMSIPFIQEILSYSQKYASSIEKDLKKKFIIAMSYACNALKESCDSKNEAVDLQIIRNVAESHIFNILFVKSCEIRHVLPIRNPDYLRLSLQEIVESLDIMRFDPLKDPEDYIEDFKSCIALGKDKFSYDGFQIFDRFINLYEIIHEGTDKSKKFDFEIVGFKESIFSKEEWRFAKKHKIKNNAMIEILFTMNFIDSTFSGRKYQQIPYSYFTPRQLGSIYESFLEYRLEIAETDMIFHKEQWQNANITSKQVRSLRLLDKHIISRDELFFSPNNKDRKMTSSYYTNDEIVRYIVEETLGPLLKGKRFDQILDLRICDPAMGSGHFLSGALDYLVNSYRAKWCEEKNDDIYEQIEETSRKILDKCIYGADVNPRAVKLAKMSLWLLTAHIGEKLKSLNDQLIVCNSLRLVQFSTANEINKTFSEQARVGFDAILANPPWNALKVNEDEFILSHSSNVNKKSSKIQKDKEKNFLYKNNPSLISEYDEHRKFIAETREYVAKNYNLQKVEIPMFATAMAEDNLYKLFTELCLKLIISTGRIGIIVPSGILSDIGTTTLRKHIIDNLSVEKIVTFRKDSDVFKKVTQSCTILICQNGYPTKIIETLFEMKSVDEFKQKLKNLTKVKIDILRKISQLTVPIFEISSNTEMSIVKKIFSHPKVYEYTDGDHTITPKCGSNTTYMAEYFADKKTSFPIAKGEDIQRFSFNKVSIGYLNEKKIANKKRLDIGSKVAIGMISGTTDYRRVRCAIIPNGAWPVNSVNYLDLSGDHSNRDWMYFLVGVINSTVIEYVVRKLCQNNNINIYAIKHLPIPVFKNEIDLHIKIVKLAKNLEKKYSHSIEKQLDSLVSNLFELDSHEYDFITSKYFNGIWDKKADIKNIKAS